MPLPLESSAASPAQASSHLALYSTVMVLAATGLTYELALGTVESFLFGDPIVQFALIVGLYMTALGLGAYLSGFLDSSLEARFCESVIVTSALGGASAPILFVVFGLDGPFRVVLYVLTGLIGALVGMQLPILMRILRRKEAFSDVVARGFAFDYAGSFAGSLLFSLALLPWVGLVRSTVVMGLLNVLAALYVQRTVGRGLAGMKLRLGLAFVVGLGLLALLFFAPRFEAITERAL